MAASVEKTWVDEQTGAKVSTGFSKAEVKWAFEALKLKLEATELPADPLGARRVKCAPADFMLMVRVEPVGFGVATQYQFKHYLTREYIVLHADGREGRTIGWTMKKSAYFTLD